MQQRSYNTKQRSMIWEYIEAKNGGEHFSVEDILEYFRKKGQTVGKSTVYRYLDKLVAQGTVKRFFNGDGESACYQYDDTAHCSEHYHCKCVDCGCLLHIDCEQLLSMSEHIENEHSFTINPSKTILYGQCEKCRFKNRNKK